MSGLFGGKPDTGALAAQEKRAAEQEAKLAAEEEARRKDDARKKTAELQARQGRRGRTSLITGLETGVAPEDQKRSSLG